MNFTRTKPPIKFNQQRSLKRSLNLHIALIVLSVASLVLKAFTVVPDGAAYTAVDQAFKAFLILGVAALTSLIVELFYSISEGTSNKFQKYESFIDPINTGLIIGLLLPISTPIYVLVVAVIVGVYAGKLAFGGYGFYIFNPALVAVLFASLSFGGQMAVSGTPLLLLKESMAGATYNFNTLDLLIGNYEAVAIGSTSVILLTLTFIYLCVTKVIDIRISLTYLLTITVLALGIGFINFGTGGMISYTFVNLVTGLTMFGATFLVAETVSSPTSRETKIIYAVVVGILVMLVRVLSNEPEGVIFAVLFGNMITPFLNRTVKRSNKAALVKTLVFTTLFTVVAAAAIGFILQARLIEAFNEVAFLGGILL